MNDEPKLSMKRRRGLIYVLPMACGACVALVGSMTSRTWGDSAVYFLAGLVGTGIAVLLAATVARIAKGRNSRSNRENRDLNTPPTGGTLVSQFEIPRR
jgi:hypothetical protein